MSSLNSPKSTTLVEIVVVVLHKQPVHLVRSRSQRFRQLVPRPVCRRGRRQYPSVFGRYRFRLHFTNSPKFETSPFGPDKANTLFASSCTQILSSSDFWTMICWTGRRVRDDDDKVQSRTRIDCPLLLLLLLLRARYFAYRCSFRVVVFDIKFRSRTHSKSPSNLSLLSVYI